MIVGAHFQRALGCKDTLETCRHRKTTSYNYCMAAAADQSGNSAAPPWLWPRSAYVHVPFCAHHCGYCDFAIAVGQDDLIDKYIHALALEFARLGKPQPMQTLFLGGGTPTHLPARDLAKLLDTVLHWLPLADGAEFSVEANPATLDEGKIAVLAEHGVNRVSLGAQSFDVGMLHVLERNHRPEDVAPTAERVRRRIATVSLDLIFGVPGQSLAQWLADLRQAVALQPDHIATYGLTYEKGTPLWKQRERGLVRPLDEEVELAMYTQAMDVLGAAGFEHYELSNFAARESTPPLSTHSPLTTHHSLLSKRCRHNQVYWANHAHFGFGMGAAQYVNGIRDLNTRDLAAYLKRLHAGQSPVFQSECLSPRDRALETVVIQLRRASGIERTQFTEQTAFDLDDLRGPTLAWLAELGLLADDGVSVRLTRRGKCVADSVVTELLKERA
jgi:oxygen-independent coproporphyrinogen III oxidase